MKTLHTEIDIDAPASRVWDILVDFERYPEWNPFIIDISGTPEVGAKLRARMQPVGSRVMTFKLKVLVAEPGEELRWLGRVGVGGIFDGEHAFVIHTSDGAGVRFVQEEKFTGFGVSLIADMGLEPTRLGFEAMNLALKLRAETASEE
jgi:hypothetical protein